MKWTKQGNSFATVYFSISIYALINHGSCSFDKLGCKMIQIRLNLFDLEEQNVGIKWKKCVHVFIDFDMWNNINFREEQKNTFDVENNRNNTVILNIIHEISFRSSFNLDNIITGNKANVIIQRFHWCFFVVNGLTLPSFIFQFDSSIKTIQKPLSLLQCNILLWGKNVLHEELSKIINFIKLMKILKWLEIIFFAWNFENVLMINNVSLTACVWWLTFFGKYFDLNRWFWSSMLLPSTIELISKIRISRDTFGKNNYKIQTFFF